MEGREEELNKDGRERGGRGAVRHRWGEKEQSGGEDKRRQEEREKKATLGKAEGRIIYA